MSPAARRAGAAAFLAALAAASLGVFASAGAPPVPRPGPGNAVEIQLLGVNDFHGHLESPTSIAREAGEAPVALGGAAALDAHLDRAAESHPGRTIRVHAGDMAGATPLISSHFHDEPAMRAANLMDFDVGTLGNHEFDEGGEEMLRLLRGGPRRDGRQFKRAADGRLVDTSDPGFEGATYPFIAANTVDREGELALPPTKVIERDGVKVGFIGVTTEATPHFLLAEHSRRFDWLDISTVVNRHAQELRRRGVEAIVVLAHSGAFRHRGDPAVAQGEIIDETREMTGAVDVVVAGHSQSPLDVRVPNREGRGDKLVVESKPYGTAFDRVRMTIDRDTGHVLGKTAQTPRTWNDEVTADPKSAALVERYRTALQGLGDRVVGSLPHSLERTDPSEPGPHLGAVAARAQRSMAGTDLAFVDRGIMRASVEAGPVTYGELFAAHAYEHPVVRMTLTGAEVLEALEQQADPVRDEPLHVAGLRFRIEGGRAVDVVVDGGRRLDPGDRYTVAANRLLVDKSEVDVFRSAPRSLTTVGTDLEALVAEVGR